MASAKEVNESLIKFSADVYAKAVEQHPGELQNMFMSPLSMYTACVMTMAGACDTTLNEMLTSLHIPKQLQGGNIHETIGAHLITQLQSSADVDVSLANRLFALTDVKATAEFTETLNKNYKAATESLGSLPSVEAKRQHINNWVSANTKSKISELIPSGGLSNDAVLTIINALYFRGLWEKLFQKESTFETDFNLLDGTKMKVMMMSSHEKYPLREFPDLDAIAVKLPFKGGRWKMLIILPNKPEGIKSLLTELHKPGKLASLLAEPFHEEKAEVYVPRFKLSKCPELNMKSVLQKCGIHSLFDRSANLSKMCTEKKLFISDVMHKAVLEVDEQGATAAASSGMVAVPMCFMPTPTVRCDHPFVLALLCDSDVPAFIGHVVKPETN